MIQSKRVIIVAHYLLYGAAHALTDYLVTKDIERLSCIFLPLATQRKTFISHFKKNRQKKVKLIEKREISRFVNLGPIDYIIDILQTVWTVGTKEKYDTFIGFDALNCLSGLFLKKIGRIKRVIFYSIDFVPVRFQNKFFNYVYHQIEIYCVKHADQVWNVSPRIAEGRRKFLHLSFQRYPQQVVPIGIWNAKIKKRSLAKIKSHQILFLGHLLEKQGVQMVLEALIQVIKKIPDIKLIIVGGGEYLSTLEGLVEKLSLKNHVTFTGWMTDREKIDEMMSESAIAVATYQPEKQQLYNFTYYADPTKLKDYLGAGLPIILTDISYNAHEISKRRCGILVQYDKDDIAKAIIKLILDRKILAEYRKNAILYAKEFDWNNIFKKVTI